MFDSMTKSEAVNDWLSKFWMRKGVGRTTASKFSDETTIGGPLTIGPGISAGPEGGVPGQEEQEARPEIRKVIPARRRNLLTRLFKCITPSLREVYQNERVESKYKDYRLFYNTNREDGDLVKCQKRDGKKELRQHVRPRCQNARD